MRRGGCKWKWIYADLSKIVRNETFLKEIHLILLISERKEIELYSFSPLIEEKAQFFYIASCSSGTKNHKSQENGWSNLLTLVKELREEEKTNVL